MHDAALGITDILILLEVIVIGKQVISAERSPGLKPTHLSNHATTKRPVSVQCKPNLVTPWEEIGLLYIHLKLEQKLTKTHDISRVFTHRANKSCRQKLSRA